MFSIYTIFLWFLSFNLYATDWERIEIPNAKCGDGKPYSVFIKKKSSEKILVEFMGGGVCWDYNSCYKRISLFPWLHTYPIIPSYSVFTADYSNINPFVEHSKLYFPYCTADVHAGNHIGHYQDKNLYHYGARNIFLSLKHLKSEGIINFETFNQLVVYGASAGGIASLIHGKKVESYFPNLVEKKMLVDSPGLHFGKNFWKKFSPEMIADFDKSFTAVQLNLDFRDGLVAKKMGPVFDYYQDWDIGFVIGLNDYVMSKIFGDISPKEQGKLILSPEGLVEVAERYPNVRVWVKNTYMHTFMLTKKTSFFESEDGKSAIDFTREIIKQN